MNGLRSTLCATLAAFALAIGTVGAGDFHVVDGDTIRSADGSFRLEGIDAPEAGQTCNSARGGRWRCGEAATNRMNALVAGQDVRCEPHGLDDYGRTLATCRSGSTNINELMVREGLAWAFRKYSMTYAAVEDAARQARRGIWQADTETPWRYRERRWEAARQDAPAGCPIKGNINAKGERIYHAPWSPWYEGTGVDPKRGERWFCTEKEALDAGWRAPLSGK